MKAVHIILYVSNQEMSTNFYVKALNLEPCLQVPGMTEFKLSDGTFLGLMPATDIKHLLGDALPDPMKAAGIPRSELYIVVDDALSCHNRALAAGARELSPVQKRNWGDDAGYSLDPDGHVIVFAQ